MTRSEPYIKDLLSKEKYPHDCIIVQEDRDEEDAVVMVHAFLDERLDPIDASYELNRLLAPVAGRYAAIGIVHSLDQRSGVQARFVQHTIAHYSSARAAVTNVLLRQRYAPLSFDTLSIPGEWLSRLWSTEINLIDSAALEALADSLPAFIRDSADLVGAIGKPIISTNWIGSVSFGGILFDARLQDWSQALITSTETLDSLMTHGTATNNHTLAA